MKKKAEEHDGEVKMFYFVHQVSQSKMKDLREISADFCGGYHGSSQ